MSGSIQRDASMAQVRRVGEAVSREVNQAPADVGGNAVTGLRFQPSAARRAQNLAKFVEKARAVDPQGAAELERIFATDFMGEIGKALTPFGLRVDDCADVYTVYWTSAWLGSRGRSDTLSKQQLAAVRLQAAKALLALERFAESSDASKQEMVEAMIVQSALIEAAVEGAQSDVARMAKVKQAILRGAQAMGLELERMTLTDAGFVYSSSRR